MDPANPPIKPKNNILKFLPSEVVLLEEIGSFSTTFKRSGVALRLIC